MIRVYRAVTITHMKNDASFKLVAAVILAGVIAAFIDSTPANGSQKSAATVAHADAAPAAQTASTTE